MSQEQSKIEIGSCVNSKQRFSPANIWWMAWPFLTDTEIIELKTFLQHLWLILIPVCSLSCWPPLWITVFVRLSVFMSSWGTACCNLSPRSSQMTDISPKRRYCTLGISAPFHSVRRVLGKVTLGVTQSPLNPCTDLCLTLCLSECLYVCMGHSVHWNVSLAFGSVNMQLYPLLLLMTMDLWF